MLEIAVLLLQDLLDAVDFDLANINLVLVLLDLDFGLFVNIFLGGSNSVQLHAHFLNSLGLRMVDVGLASDVLVALFDFSLRSLVLLSHVALAVLVLSKLDFNVT